MALRYITMLVLTKLHRNVSADFKLHRNVSAD